MAITDNFLRLANGLSLVGAGPFYTPTGSVVDLAATDLDGTTILSKLDPGAGCGPLCAQVYPGTALDNVTDMTVEVVIAENTGLTTNPIVIGGTGAIPLTEWNTAGKPIIVRLNPNPELLNQDPSHSSAKRYMGLRFTKTGTNAAAGTVTADLVTQPHDPIQHYPTKSTITT